MSLACRFWKAEPIKILENLEFDHNSNFLGFLFIAVPIGIGLKLYTLAL